MSLVYLFCVLPIDAIWHNISYQIRQCTGLWSEAVKGRGTANPQPVFSTAAVHRISNFHVGRAVLF